MFCSSASYFLCRDKYILNKIQLSTDTNINFTLKYVKMDLHGTVVENMPFS